MWTGPNDAPVSTKKERMKALRKLKRIQKEIKDNPRTIFQCVARGCEGCNVCKPESPSIGVE